MFSEAGVKRVERSWEVVSHAAESLGEAES
jgi:hypothetical protein